MAIQKKGAYTEHGKEMSSRLGKHTRHTDPTKFPKISRYGMLYGERHGRKHRMQA